MRSSQYSTFDDPHLAEISRIVGFTPDDLARNRQNTLSIRQIEKLDRQFVRSASLSGNIFLAIAICSLIVSILTLPGGVICACLTLILVGFALISFDRGNLATKALSNSRVFSSLIRVDQFNKAVGMLPFRIYLTTDTGERVEVTHILLHNLQVGRFYRVYLIDLGGRQHGILRNKLYLLASIEPTNKWMEKTKRKRKRKPKIMRHL